MSAQHLRPYQIRAADAAQAARRAIVVAPPGAGKTTIAAEIIRRELAKPRAGHSAPRRWVLFLAHRKELIAQAARRIHDHGILDPSIIMAGHSGSIGGARVQVASVQTLARRRATLNTFADSISLVIIDEAHRAAAKSYTSILERLPHARIVGLTASPYRLDGKALGDLFDELIVAAQPDELIAAGHLIEPRIYAQPLGAALRGVAKARGDYARGELSSAMNTRELTGRVVDHYLRLAAGRRAVVFACGCDHSRQLTKAFRAAGVAAAHLDAQTPQGERDRVLEDLRSGRTQVICNVEILTEGWDLPELGAVILARPTMSPGLFIQMVGRVLRPKPDGGGGIIIDHAACVTTHGWPTARREWSLSAPEARPRAEEPLPGFSNCRGCFALFCRRGLEECPECGLALSIRERRKPPIETRAELVELNRDLKEKASAEAALAASRLFVKDTITADRKGYSQGWAAVRYKSRCGRWPTGGLRAAALRALYNGRRNGST